ncbi:MAG: DNA polymerase III subunit delta' [Sedimentibacter sp.]|uniref:DNA polymerase III subunit delta' n=1 Tax=Sedimentibacter sp. TaxID=1960295 RepID=UPI00298197B9|nr:DNA polymerase III subunit delta' [Sedimentibacter sp.]MDW5300589.1 DNA polymerase III subunit delta' [Sedimentibacter sp.]
MLYSQVAGQEEIKISLIKSINNSQVSHCYIFEGPKGMGKYDLALIFAQSLLCSDFHEEPCNVCSNCIKMNSMNHPDLHIVNQEESTIKRESIDELIESIYKKSYESNRKVYIIKDAHLMTTQAANTFLKTLEEPPGDSVMILLTTNINLLIPTITSRCQIVKFRNISKETIKTYLNEHFNTEEDIADLAANYSKGILNKAVNIVNGNDSILKKREEIIKVFDKIINTDSEIIYEVENYFEENKDNIDLIIETIMLWIRDIIFVQNNMEDLVINKDFVNIAKQYSESMRADSDIIEYLQNTSENIKSNVNYKLAIDNMLLKIQEVFK